MVRPARPADLDAAAAIWLEGNLSAHDFIPPQYWQGNVELVKGLLAQAEVYVYEDEGEVLGFLGRRTAILRASSSGARRGPEGPAGSCWRPRRACTAA